MSCATFCARRLALTSCQNVFRKFVHEDAVTSRYFNKKLETKSKEFSEEQFSVSAKSIGLLKNSGHHRCDLNFKNMYHLATHTISQNCGKHLLARYSTCVFGNHGQTFLLYRQALDNNVFLTRNFHQVLLVKWKPCAGMNLLVTGEHPCIAEWKDHQPLKKLSNGALAVPVCFKSTTTSRDKVRARLQRKLPDLKEEELEEQFVRGSGPGGQATNKTSNCVVLKHIPTGLVVKCHQTRSQSENQKIARLLMKEKLDQHLHGNQSAQAQHQQVMHKKREEKKRKTRLKLEKLKVLRASGDEEESGSSGNQDAVKDKVTFDASSNTDRDSNSDGKLV
ncbi:peptide chain release factor 1-like [Lytechinus variegatus]|uniref:peptide chain release factor 1-like n=1 Tax=Lytechinus variegatus TaxID=7654 RepID=UPI001BB265EA|nr:peptide chain release factor 1-like [Lytechinus variegatus]